MTIELAAVGDITLHHAAPAPIATTIVSIEGAPCPGPAASDTGVRQKEE